MLRENRDKLLNLFNTFFLSHSLASLWAVTSLAEIVKCSRLRTFVGHFRSPTDSHSRSHHMRQTTYDCRICTWRGYLYSNCLIEESCVRDCSSNGPGISASCPLFHPATTFLAWFLALGQSRHIITAVSCFVVRSLRSLFFPTLSEIRPSNVKHLPLASSANVLIPV